MSGFKSESLMELENEQLNPKGNYLPQDGAESRDESENEQLSDHERQRELSTSSNTSSDSYCPQNWLETTSNDEEEEPRYVLSDFVPILSPVREIIEIHADSETNSSYDSFSPQSYKQEINSDCGSVMEVDTDYEDLIVNEDDDETDEENRDSAVKISRFTKVYYTYTRDEYDRSSVDLAQMTTHDWDEWDFQRKVMRQDYISWLVLNDLDSFHQLEQSLDDKRVQQQQK